jgi:HD superfamily phosphohydrolase
MKSFRDPVHNLIAFDDDDKWIVDLINTREVQRLRRIRQLGLSNIAYPGAEHSRFVHSLGVLHLMRRVLDAPTGMTGPDQRSELREHRRVALAAALLHDVGHGPFSHALESLTGVRHERWTAAIIRTPEAEVHQVLEGVETGLSERVAQVIEGQFTASRAVVKLLSSQLDVDRMDYLLRDAMMTGAGYGSFDIEWLLHVMRIGHVDGDLEVGLDLTKGRSIAEDYIMCRYYMYLHVYFHRVTRAAEVLVERLLARAAQRRAPVPFTPALAQLLGERLQPATHLSSYLELDDNVVWTAAHVWQRDDDEVLADLADRLLNRRVFRAWEDEVNAAPVGERASQLSPMGQQRLDLLQREARRRGLPEDYYVLVDFAQSNAYADEYVARSANGEGRGGEGIFLFDESGAAHELATVSFIAGAVRERRVQVVRLLYPPEWELEGGVAR